MLVALVRPAGTTACRHRPERNVVDDLHDQLAAEITPGHDVVLDHRLGLRPDRVAWCEFAETSRAAVLSRHLPADRGELLGRRDERNQREHANAPRVTPVAFANFFARFDPPEPDEHAVIYTAGDSTAILK